MSRANVVKGYQKSIILGGAHILHPIPHEHISAFAATIKEVIREAEDDAYNRGRRDAQAEMRAAIGIGR